jgi:hypothetical protein
MRATFSAGSAAKDGTSKGAVETRHESLEGLDEALRASGLLTTAKSIQIRSCVVTF